MLMQILIGIGLLIGMLWGIANPFAGLITLEAAAIISPGETYPIFATLHVERILVLVVLASFLMTGERLRIQPISKKIFAFWALMFIAVPFAFYKGGALTRAIDFNRIVIYHLLIISLVNTPKRFRVFVIVSVLLTGWIAWGGFYMWMTGSLDERAMKNGLERIGGMTSNLGSPNALGMALVSSLPIIGLLLFQGETKKQKLIALAIGILSIFVVILTASRTAFAVMIGLIGLFFFTRKHGFAYIPVALLVLMLIWFMVPANLRDRYTGIADVMTGQQADESYMARVYTRQSGWQMFKDYPLFGVGAGQFKNACGMKYWAGPGRKLWFQPHNLYIQILAELGIFGVIVWGTFLVSLFIMCRRVKKELAAIPDVDPLLRWFPTAVLFALIVRLIAGWATHPLYREFWYEYAALCGALQLIAAKLTAQRKERLHDEAVPVEAPAYALANERLL